MKKYNEEYFSVIDKRTGRKIADCGEWSDARMLLHMDTQNRQIVKNKFLMSPVVDVEIRKQLPTSNIAVSDVKENGCAPRKEQLLDAGQIKLPEGQGEPVIIR
jgi:hypothetical protein